MFFSVILIFFSCVQDKKLEWATNPAFLQMGRLPNCKKKAGFLFFCPVHRFFSLHSPQFLNFPHEPARADDLCTGQKVGDGEKPESGF